MFIVLAYPGCLGKDAFYWVLLMLHDNDTTFIKLVHLRLPHLSSVSPASDLEN